MIFRVSESAQVLGQDFLAAALGGRYHLRLILFWAAA